VTRAGLKPMQLHWAPRHGQWRFWGGPGWAMPLPRFLLGTPFCPPVFLLNSHLSSFGWHMQGCQMCFVKIPAILSTAPDLSFVEIRKQHRENRDNQYCLATINNLLYFGWFVTFRCVCDVPIAPTIASTAANKLRWRNCADNIHYKSHYDLRNSALFLFEVTANYFIFIIPASATHFQNTGLCWIN